MAGGGAEDLLELDVLGCKFCTATLTVSTLLPSTSVTLSENSIVASVRTFGAWNFVTAKSGFKRATSGPLICAHL